jgi:hypothetical protein
MARYGFAAVVFIMTIITAAAASAAPPGFDGAFGGESAFLSLHRGDTGNLQVFFANLGTTTWTRGSATEVVLSVCVDTPLPQGFRCNVLSPYADWALNWTSARSYATTTQTSLGPGAIGTFSFNVKVPLDAPLGDFYFRGELVHAATGTLIHPVGFYQVVTVIQ